MLNETHKFDDCIDCKKCMSGCVMLHDFTTSPKTLLQNFKQNKPSSDISFSCATCNYCYSVCPSDISFKEVFKDAKIEHAKSDKILKSFGYKSVLFHQKHSFSKMFTAKTKFSIGEYKNMAFMPGCALSSYSPKLVHDIYSHLHFTMPGINILQQCCGQPTRIVGDINRFTQLYSKLSADINTMQIDTVITACENCYVSLKEFSPTINVVSLYDILAHVGIPKNKIGVYSTHKNVALHDPCPTRHENSLHVSVRKLLDKLGLNYEEFKNNREKTECCGSGGMLELTNPKLAIEQMNSRANQTSCDTIVSYCQSCAESMSRGGKNGVHILDLIFADNVIEGFSQKKNSVVKKWYNRYKSKKMIEKLC
ncbi:(Fe-S)-binding protein [Sulfurospirillum arcachonense]|uniref:(Fe-S)-binding protein n=1 Tax=Sulfurospirillum arcachonense TaxID=57666 RepID=UPI00046A547B|nr:(Fe-S)-binding protein [Sulfurospirillum arcachonense]